MQTDVHVHKLHVYVAYKLIMAVRGLLIFPKFSMEAAVILNFYVN